MSSPYQSFVTNSLLQLGSLSCFMATDKKKEYNIVVEKKRWLQANGKGKKNWPLSYEKMMDKKI